MIRSISILSQARLKAYELLLQKKHREEQGKFIVEGSHVIEEALSAGWSVEVVLLTPEFRAAKAGAPLLERVGRLGVECAEVTSRMASRLTDTVTPQGAVAIVRKPKKRAPGPRTGGNLTVALDGVSDPGNLGTMLRTCDWFGVQSVLLGKGCVEPYNPKLLRSTMGSLFHLDILDNVDLVGELGRMKADGFEVRVAAVSGGAPPGPVGGDQRLAMVFGNESRGVSPGVSALADATVSIPSFGKAESLNVATACGIILALLRQK